jgi:hypothetical protein
MINTKIHLPRHAGEYPKGMTEFEIDQSFLKLI